MMKSIKEKADEHAPYTREDSWSRVQKCIIAQTSFEAGANYVLEQIEQLIKFNRWTAQDLYEIIEQLKEIRSYEKDCITSTYRLDDGGVQV